MLQWTVVVLEGESTEPWKVLDVMDGDVVARRRPMPRSTTSGVSRSGCTASQSDTAPSRRWSWFLCNLPGSRGPSSDWEVLTLRGNLG